MSDETIDPAHECVVIQKIIIEKLLHPNGGISITPSWEDGAELDEVLGLLSTAEHMAVHHFFYHRDEETAEETEEN